MEDITAMYEEILDNFQTCNGTVLKEHYPEDGQLYCNATFDGYTCWDYTKAGTRSYGKCPHFMTYHFGDSLGLPFKDCNIDGTWYRHPDTNKPWTDYSQCVHTERVQRALNVLYVYFSGYSLSIISLIISIAIFVFFRQLKCTRVTIHIHLFMSYIITGIIWIIYYATTSFIPHVLVENPVWCRILHVIAHYLTICNYAWMLCEGFYLHTMLVAAFSNEKTLLRVCCLVGWGIPVLPSVIYSGFRWTDSIHDLHCWHDYTYLIWILTGPVALSLLFIFIILQVFTFVWLSSVLKFDSIRENNFFLTIVNVLNLINVVFLVNILRILCSKVRSAGHSQPNPVRQSMRAALTLMPLLGVQFCVLPLRPPNGDEKVQHVYDLISAILTSFQGFLVALLFCFSNGEVLLLFQSRATIYRRKSNISRSDIGREYNYTTVRRVSDKNDKETVQMISKNKMNYKFQKARSTVL